MQEKVTEQHLTGFTDEEIAAELKRRQHKAYAQKLLMELHAKLGWASSEQHLRIGVLYGPDTALVSGATIGAEVMQRLTAALQVAISAELEVLEGQA